MFNELQTKLHMVLDRFSNSEPVEIKDEWIEEAGESFKAALKKQFTRTEEPFRLRMSNIGRPLCQLQKDAAGTEKSRKDPSFVMKMLIGDAVEAAMIVVIKAAQVNLTGSKVKVGLQVNDTLIRGEDDIEIDNRVWDVKSSSNWAFNNKWKHGWNGIYDGDTFGYVAQLYGYATAQNKEVGGWIVVNKETGETLVVHATPTKEQILQIQENIEFTERAIATKLPFKRQFQDEEETFYKKKTGNRTLPITCTFCDFRGNCWPEAQLKSQALSQAKNPKSVWYSLYVETTDGNTA